LNFVHFDQISYHSFLSIATWYSRTHYDKIFLGIGVRGEGKYQHGERFGKQFSGTESGQASPSSGILQGWVYTSESGIKICNAGATLQKIDFPKTENEACMQRRRLKSYV
jgi:hypothetical protein